MTDARAEEEIGHDTSLTDIKIDNLITNFDRLQEGAFFYYCVFAHRHEPDDVEGLSGFPFCHF